MRLAALLLASLSVSAGPAVGQDGATESLIHLEGDCASLVMWDEDRSVDCQDGLLVRKYDDGRIHFSVSVTSGCCALSFEGCAEMRFPDGDAVIQIIDRISFHRAGGPPIWSEGVGDCRWFHVARGPMTIACAFSGAHDGKSTLLLFEADGAAADPQRF